MHKSVATLAALLALTLASLVFAACGGDDEPAPTTDDGAEEATTEGPAEDVEVIRDWSEALTEGDIEAAAEYFATPSVAENGIVVEIESADDAQLFNESLPCGAELESTEAQGEFITATFRLTTRPGVAECPGEGNTAQTSFVIEDGLIAEWRRVGLEPAPDPGSEGGQTT